MFVSSPGAIEIRGEYLGRTASSPSRVHDLAGGVRATSITNFWCSLRAGGGRRANARRKRGSRRPGIGPAGRCVGPPTKQIGAGAKEVRRLAALRQPGDRIRRWRPSHISSSRPPDRGGTTWGAGSPGRQDARGACRWTSWHYVLIAAAIHDVGSQVTTTSSVSAAGVGLGARASPDGVGEVPSCPAARPHLPWVGNREGQELSPLVAKDFLGPGKAVAGQGLRLP